MHPLTAVKRDPTRERKRGKPSIKKGQKKEAARGKSPKCTTEGPWDVALLAYQGRLSTSSRQASRVAGKAPPVKQTFGESRREQKHQ
jgi:hypothetical protein